MHDFVRKMIAQLDEETRQRGSTRTIWLMGDPESRYLQDIESKAHKLGLKTTREDGSEYRPTVAVLDTECKDEEVWRQAMEAFEAMGDIDCVANPGLSCCADACLRVIQHEVRGGSLVAITGRGHAAQGLSRFLAERSYSPMVVHSESDLGAKICAMQCGDALIHTSNRFVWPFAAAINASIVLDVCGEKQKAKFAGADYFGHREIGALNISILLRRFVEV